MVYRPQPASRYLDGSGGFQFMRTVIGDSAGPCSTVLKRKREPSPLGAYWAREPPWMAPPMWNACDAGMARFTRMQAV